MDPQRDDPLPAFDPTNGQVDGLDGDSDGTVSADTQPERERPQRSKGLDSVIAAVGSHRF